MKLNLIISLFLLLVAGTANASLVVAAKDSPGKKKADYKCDGKDDQVEIQQAIDALPSGGGVVELLEGTFNFGDDVEITKNNVTIKGAGKSTILKHNPTYWVKLTKDAKKGDKTIVVENSKQFHIGQLLGITNEDINPTAEGSPEKFKEIAKSGGSCYYYTFYLIKGDLYLVKQIRGNTITLDRGLENPMLVSRNPRTAPAWVMIKAYGKENLELKDFSIDCNKDNIAKIRGNSKYSHHPGPEPVRPKDYKCPFPQLVKKVHHGEEPQSAIYMDSAHNSKFINLYIHDISSTGMLLIKCDYVLVQSNTIRNFGLKGYVNPFGDYTQIIGNLVENSLYEDGINVYANAASFAVVSNNIVRNCPRACISLNQSRKATVSGNVVYGGGVGIVAVSQEATVTGNYVEHSGVAISIQSLHEYWGDANADYPITVMGNTIKDCDIAFDVRHTNHVNLTGNSASGIKGRGAVVSTGSLIGSRFIISSNQFLNGSSENSAIWLGGDNHFVFGNKIKSFKKGVQLDSTAEGNVIERNEFIEVSESIVDEGKENIQKDNFMHCATKTE